MAYTTSMNNGATATEAHSSGFKSMNVQAVNPVDWTPVERSNNRIVLTNSGNSDYSAPNRVRIERSTVSNIYEGSGIQSNYQLPSKRGLKLFVQNSAVATLRNSADVTDVIMLPYVASLTLRVPVVPTDIVSYANIVSMLQQLYGVVVVDAESSAAAHQGAALAGYLNGNLDLSTKTYA